jgi:hypothetical protein
MPVTRAIETFLSERQQYMVGVMLHHLVNERAAERLWQRDASLWYPAPDTQARIRQRLGWLDLPSPADVEAALTPLRAAINQHAAEQIIYVAPSVLGRAARLWLSLVDQHSNLPHVLLLDSAEPTTVEQALAQRARKRTLVVHAGAFDTPQAAALAEALPSDVVVPLPPTVGERFGALSVAALAPAALLGLDWDQMLSPAASVQDCAHFGHSFADNHYSQLGASLGTLAQAGHDLLYILATPRLEPLARWIEALVAGALSKHWRGFVPVVGLPPAPRYAQNSLVLALRHADDPAATLAAQVEKAQQMHVPVVRLTVHEQADIAAYVMLWQLAVAVAAVVLGLNPFDAPDADVINARMAQQREHPPVVASPTVMKLRGMLRDARFLAIAAFLPQAYDADLRALQAAIGATYGLPVALIFPLRDAAFSLQLLHAGRQGGLVLALSAAQAQVDQRMAGLAKVEQAQLAVELETWQRMRQPHVHVNLHHDIHAGLAQVAAELLACSGQQ